MSKIYVEIIWEIVFAAQKITYLFLVFYYLLKYQHYLTTVKLHIFAKFVGYLYHI